MDKLNLNISRFVELRENHKDIDLGKLKETTQSIYHFIQYTHYHYHMIEKSTSFKNLRDDRLFQVTREGENVQLRFVYEANIVAFLNSLHSLLDSFPYLLNLFMPELRPESTDIKWNIKFIKKYEKYSFYNELIAFMFDENFNKVKGYVNTVKHKHLVQVANTIDNLEFIYFSYKQPFYDDEGKIKYKSVDVNRANVRQFIEDGHDKLIKKFFSLCKSVLAAN